MVSANLENTISGESLVENSCRVHAKAAKSHSVLSDVMGWHKQGQLGLSFNPSIEVKYAGHVDAVGDAVF